MAASIADSSAASNAMHSTLTPHKLENFSSFFAIIEQISRAINVFSPSRFS
jgi:hypothetical protein